MYIFTITFNIRLKNFYFLQWLSNTVIASGLFKWEIKGGFLKSSKQKVLKSIWYKETMGTFSSLERSYQTLFGNRTEVKENTSGTDRTEQL